MKIKKGYLVRDIADTYIVVPVGERVIDFKGIMTLNETGYFLWNRLVNDISYDDLLKALLDEYEVDEVTAKNDLDEFLEVARENDLLDE
jgi:hypothetical protein